MSYRYYLYYEGRDLLYRHGARAVCFWDNDRWRLSDVYRRKDKLPPSDGTLLKVTVLYVTLKFPQVFQDGADKG